MSGALVGLAGVVVGALISALVTLRIARSANDHMQDLALEGQAHVERLAEIGRREREAAETRQLRVDAYRDLARLVGRVSSTGPHPDMQYPTVTEIADCFTWVRAVGSTEMRRRLHRFSAALPEGGMQVGDRRQLDVSVHALLDQIGTDLGALADSSRTERPD